ncbi:uncharacterized protein CLUP02_01142 [Colletotrichum lupini]|uniref:Uncharacterized protein n=1 Tax=Colletotrichum lupini TaxID=145971 RepID=A0A9Q8SBR5_9PEZI|nr:uncharacterized protein CLUP02_01142 [Colletotrichum lupini]UQC74491.1 hypothetical protein CLUP02_01142 [Colletotrichum lupini]
MSRCRMKRLSTDTSPRYILCIQIRYGGVGGKSRGEVVEEDKDTYLSYRLEVRYVLCLSSHQGDQNPSTTTRNTILSSWSFAPTSLGTWAWTPPITPATKRPFFLAFRASNSRQLARFPFSPAPHVVREVETRLYALEPLVPSNSGQPDTDDSLFPFADAGCRHAGQGHFLFHLWVSSFLHPDPAVQRLEFRVVPINDRLNLDEAGDQSLPFYPYAMIPIFADVPALFPSWCPTADFQGLLNSQGLPLILVIQMDDEYTGIDPDSLHDENPRPSRPQPVPSNKAAGFPSRSSILGPGSPSCPAGRGTLHARTVRNVTVYKIYTTLAQY